MCILVKVESHDYQQRVCPDMQYAKALAALLSSVYRDTYVLIADTDLKYQNRYVFLNGQMYRYWTDSKHDSRGYVPAQWCDPVTGKPA